MHRARVHLLGRGRSARRAGGGAGAVRRAPEEVSAGGGGRDDEREDDASVLHGVSGGVFAAGSSVGAPAGGTPAMAREREASESSRCVRASMPRSSNSSSVRWASITSRKPARPFT